MDLKYQRINNNLLGLYEGNEEIVQIKDGVVEICRGSFREDCIKKIVIPASVKKINEGAFIFGADNTVKTYFGCVNLEEFVVDPKNPNYSSIDGNLYNKDGSILLQYAPGKKAECFYLPEGVKSISHGSLGFSKNLRKIVLPQTFGSDEFLFFFPKCLEEIEIEINEDNPKYKVIDGNVYSNDEKVFVLYNKTKKAKNFIIPNGVEVIDDCAFYDCRLEQIVIPNTVKEIGESAFGYSYNLRSIVIPNSVVKMKTGAFESCHRLESILLSNSLKEIPSFAFSTTAIKELFIPSSVIKIGEHAFEVCEELKSVYVPKTVKEIGVHAFSECYELADVVLQEGLEEIGSGAFADTKIEMIKIPSTVKALGDGIFDSCNFLRAIFVSREYRNLPEDIKVIKC